MKATVKTFGQVDICIIGPGVGWPQTRLSFYDLYTITLTTTENVEFHDVPELPKVREASVCQQAP